MNLSRSLLASAALALSLFFVAKPARAAQASADQPPAGDPVSTAAAPVEAGAPPVVQAAGKTGPSVPAWLEHLTIGGGAVLWYYEPFLSDVENNFSLFFANVLLDARFGNFGVHLEPRFRETKLRPFFDGPAWVQEAYAYFTVTGEEGNLVLKAGKAYSHFGLFWDNSFYGNVQVYDGLKLDPNYGLSLEGELGTGRRVGARGFAQFFVIDGQTNVSLPGRDTFSIPGARRRNQLIGRVEPFFALGRQGVARLGLSAELLQAELPVVGKQDVFRGGADLTVALGGATLWGEYIRQNGQTVTEFPIAGVPAAGGSPAVPGQASKHNNYLLAGGEYTWRRLTGRYVWSWGDYRDVDVTEQMHVPALGYAVHANLSLLSELVIWQRHAPTGTTFVDRSLNVTLSGHF